MANSHYEPGRGPTCKYRDAGRARYPSGNVIGRKLTEAELAEWYEKLERIRSGHRLPGAYSRA